MKNTEHYEKGLDLFAKIMVMQELEKSSKSELNSEDYDRQAVRMNNVVEIAEGNDFDAMSYLSDIETEDDNYTDARRKEVFKSTSDHEKDMIILWKNFYETGDIKPLQDMFDRLI